MTAQLISFELVRQEIPLDLGKTGKPTHILREMDGEMRDAYLNALVRKLDRSGEGKGSVKDFRGMQAALLSRCLFVVETGAPMPEAAIQALPAKTLQGLFKLAQDLNGLQDETAPKKTEGDTEDDAAGE